MNEPTDPPWDALTRGLAFSAITPGLRSILLLDATPSTLQTVAERLTNMVEIATGREVNRVTIGSTETDDVLFGNLAPLPRLADLQNLSLGWRPGLLTQCEQDESSSRLVVIPDLSRLSLATARACVVLIGASEAHVERHGTSKRWIPNLYWLAACASPNLARISRHLLDRFAFRLRAPVLAARDDAPDQCEQLNNNKDSEVYSIPELDVSITDNLRAAPWRFPIIRFNALKMIARTLERVRKKGVRRELALARAAVAYARLVAAPTVTKAHVAIAAETIGIPPTALGRAQSQRDANPVPSPPGETEPTQDIKKEDETLIKRLPGDTVLPPEKKSIELPVHVSERPNALAPTVVELAGDHPYREDSLSSQRDPGSLQLPVRRYATTSVSRGSVIGVERASSLHDLAIVSTILEAAKFQRARRTAIVAGGTSAPSGLFISAADLRTYRRAAVPEKMLLIVLDYTCLPKVDRIGLLMPQLAWAYVERASVCLIQVGVAGSACELRAHCIYANSVLSPKLDVALQAEVGRATPLAHGLELAFHVLRNSLYHGRTALRQGRLVVFSDGRGNVPLAASQAAQILSPVKHEGIDDALRTASYLGRLRNVECIYLNPMPRVHASLPASLADVLGAEMIECPEPSTTEARR